jgi:hypothetical protein
MSDTHIKNGPIHFYPTAERNSFISNVVEYCVHIGERQPLTQTQASWLVARGDVVIDGSKPRLDLILLNGTWEINIRGRKHHVIVHPAITE